MELDVGPTVTVTVTIITPVRTSLVEHPSAPQEVVVIVVVESAVLVVTEVTISLETSGTLVVALSAVLSFEVT